LRAGQQGSLSRSWAIKGTRPRRIRQRQFKSSYIFGAICPRKDKGVALILPHANTEAMQLHLDEISKNVTKGYHAVIVMDKAGWHLANDLIIPKNITLIKLPPYSPELNPMEQVFQQLRKLKLSNACYKNHEDIDAACVEAWNSFVEKKGNIKSLALRDWADVC
jgi:transposase